MTARERVQNLLERKPADRAAFNESLWPETVKRWTDAGHLKKDESAHLHFKMEIESAGWLNSSANLDVADQVVEENEETKLVRNSNGALLRWWKNKSGTPEHVDFLVKDRAGWEEHIKPFLKPDRRRTSFEGYRDTKKAAAERQNFFCWAGVNVFEQMHPMCGHEHMLAGMALDPDWIAEVARTYADLTIGMWEMLFAEHGLPDGIFFYEDMGFKEKPFMSPAMYRALILPAHQRTIGWAHQRGLRVVMHSCGFIEPLVPGMIEAGIDMLQAMEVKAGMKEEDFAVDCQPNSVYSFLRSFHPAGSGLRELCVFPGSRAGVGDLCALMRISCLKGGHVPTSWSWDCPVIRNKVRPASGR
jgi:uroporphyrinogen decarboxylase